MQTLGERLSWALSQTGLSQRGLARAAKLQSQRHIGLLSSGERDNPELKTLQAIAGALGVSVGWLAEGEGQTPDPEHIKITALAAYAAAEAERKPPVDEGGAAPAA